LKNIAVIPLTDLSEKPEPALIAKPQPWGLPGKRFWRLSDTVSPTKLPHRGGPGGGHSAGILSAMGLERAPRLV